VFRETASSARRSAPAGLTPAGDRTAKRGTNSWYETEILVEIQHGDGTPSGRTDCVNGSKLADLRQTALTSLTTIASTNIDETSGGPHQHSSSCSRSSSSSSEAGVFASAAAAAPFVAQWPIGYLCINRWLWPFGSRHRTSERDVSKTKADRMDRCVLLKSVNRWSIYLLRRKPNIIGAYGRHSVTAADITVLDHTAHESYI